VQRRPLHCSGFNRDNNNVSSSCEIYNPIRQAYDSFPDLPVTFEANPLSFQLVRCAQI
jgi:hypothetical protein